MHLLNSFQESVKDAVDYFLDCVASWTPRWFNKPKFHVLLHIIEHISRFGPPHTYATETFESYNSLIRDFSIHSNRQAPSRDIGYGFANANRIRHLVSGAKFMLYEDATATTASKETSRSASSRLYDASKLRSVGPRVLELFQHDHVLRQLCGYLIEEQNPKGCYILIV